jgi:hypothetical protein
MALGRYRRCQYEADKGSANGLIVAIKPMSAFADCDLSADIPFPTQLSPFRKW